MERRRYRHPPIEEALCEFLFTPTQEWEFGRGLAVGQRLKDEYGGKTLLQQHMGARVAVGSALPGPPFQMMADLNARVQFRNADNTRLIGVGQDVLSVHALRPYQGWDEFRPQIVRALAAFTDEVRPGGVARIVVRYINRVVLPNVARPLADFFTLVARPPADLPQPPQSILTRWDLSPADAPIRLMVTIGDLEASPNQRTTLLDLETVQNWPADSPLVLDQAVNEAENLKRRQHAVFEAIITNATREVIDAP